ncbi:tRNA (mnm(5)s(2)U34)-methyltransferase [Clostridium sp. Cult2]|uniref:tRNA (mnm(5)s(2)U34)-methyltransferase n=1 Tax=Clostridium sp. Cult2 TaxID=2079003 RepID=UPI001F3D985E|nr:class I SAM-dependent methyltransferase [Clostridium sp. Cult2]MCF6465116.1 16S rRNA (cytosine(1402)-N(4))-methyltransferase [Clostridium sp. Cult2]
MGYKYFINTVDLAKKIMKGYVKIGDIVLDCTVGNGNDTILLAQLVGEKGKVYGFDIQTIALKITKEKLIEENLANRVTLIKEGHENIDKYIFEKIDFAIYNLGYLPGGDKNIITNIDTTLVSIKKSLSLLNENGLLLITCYTGHKGGLEEKEGVKDFLNNLNQKEYNVLEFNFVNQKNNPPVLFGVEKL